MPNSKCQLAILRASRLNKLPSLLVTLPSILTLLVHPGLCLGFSNHFYSGSCIPISNQPIPWPAICHKSQLSANAISFSRTATRKTGRDNFVNYYGSTYIGTHFNQYVSLHGKASQSRVNPQGNTPKIKEKRTNHFFLQIGSPILSTLKLSLGRLPLPFGIGHGIFPNYFENNIKNTSYWEGPRFGIRFSYTNHRDRQVDFAVHAPTTLIKHIDHPTTTLRISKDISPLSGTRLVFSLLSEETTRRLGFGVLNRIPSGGFTFEWVRVISKGTHIGSYPTRQLVVVNYFQTFINKNRWIFEYQEELKHHWISAIGYDQMISRQTLVRFQIFYFKSQVHEESNRWVTATGAQINL